MVTWPSKWYCAGWGIASFLMLISGLDSGNVVPLVFGAVGLSVATSIYLMYYVRSEHRVKRSLEVVFTVLALGSVIYGYVATGNIILGILTLFIVGLICVAFILSYLLPKIRSQSKRWV